MKKILLLLFMIVGLSSCDGEFVVTNPSYSYYPTYHPYYHYRYEPVIVHRPAPRAEWHRSNPMPRPQNSPQGGGARSRR